MSANDGPRFHEILRLEDPCLPAYLRLYETAFPPKERDPVASVVALLGERAWGDRDGDHLLAMIENENDFVGLAHYVCHAGDDAAYLPYLAVVESRRGAGLGGQLFLEVARRLLSATPPPRALILEVEDPDIQPEAERSLAKRRIGFYERHGSHLLGGIQYVQRVEFCPEGIPMRLMGRPLPEITEDAFRMACELFGDAVSRSGTHCGLDYNPGERSHAMSMVPFYTRFRDLAFQEMQTITLLTNEEGVPAGEYGFLEFYCDEPGCDCRRVHINVVEPPPNPRTWASINYGWEDAAFYHQWGLSGPAEETKGPFLDPLNPQSEYAPAFLRLFKQFCLADKAYVAAPIRHYGMFKGTLLEQDAGGRIPLGPMIRTKKPGHKGRGGRQ